MNFDLTEINYLDAIITWAVVFFGVFSVAAFLAWVFAGTVGGVRGRQKLFANLTRGPLRPVCWVLSIVAACGIGYLAYRMSIQMRGLVHILLNPFTPAIAVEDRPTWMWWVRMLDRTSVTLFAAMFAGFGGFMLVPAVLESCRINFGRVGTIAKLTWTEAVRRRALYVFVVFAMLFMFAGWFLSDSTERADMQVKVYVSFVLTTITWLTLPVMLLLACWGIPEDIRLRSMHTVVTKPVRRNEIFLGRVVGFSLVGTVVILVMGSIGYLWIIRQVPASVTDGKATVDGREVVFGTTREGYTQVKIANARGENTIYEAPTPADLRRENPEIYQTYREAHRKYVGTLLTARDPVHGTLSFYDSAGKPTNAGVNVGDVWAHRSYIEGLTEARASYLFENVTPDLMIDYTQLTVGPDGSEVPETVKRLQLETSFEAFRTFKGKDIEQSVLVQLHFVKALRRELAEGVAGIYRSNPGATDFRPLSREVEQGNFAGAADRLAELANGYRTRQLEFPAEVSQNLPRGYERVAAMLDGFEEAWADDLATTSREVADAVRAENGDRLATALDALAKLFREHEGELDEKVVDLDVAYSPPFQIQEYIGNVLYVPRKITVQGEARTVDLFDDLVHDGQLRIEVYCLDRSQYLGMARPDLFIRKPDNAFLSGFAKALLGIWLLVVLVVLVGVTCSTFVKGPVATFATATFVIVGVFFHGFLIKVVTNQEAGSGAIESGYRMYAHLNPNVALDQTATYAGIQAADSTIKGGLWVVSNTIPDLNVFFLNRWVASGFDIRWDSGLAPAVFTLLAYLLPCLMLGFYSLKLRELEAK